MQKCKSLYSQVNISSGVVVVERNGTAMLYLIRTLHIDQHVSQSINVNMRELALLLIYLFYCLTLSQLNCSVFL